MKTIKTYCILFIISGLTWFTLAGTNEKLKTRLELLKGTWTLDGQLKEYPRIRIFAKVRSSTYLINKGDTIKIFNLFYLSNTVDTVFIREKLGSNDGKYLIVQERPTLKDRNPRVDAFEIIKLTSDEFSFVYIPRTLTIGLRPLVYKRKK